MAGSVMAAFTDWLIQTGPTIVTPTDEMINDATLNTYFMEKALKGRGIDDVLQGGSTIRDYLMINAGGNWAAYLPNDVFTPSPTQNTVYHEIPWRFSKGELVYTEQEIMLQGGGDTSALKDGALLHIFKNLKRSKEQSVWTGAMNYFEQSVVWAPPSIGMEGGNAAGTAQYSIPTYIVENMSTYLPPSGVWTLPTLMGINPAPAANAYWRNQVSGYDSTQPLDPQQGIFNAFDTMYRKTQWDRLPMKSQYGETDERGKMMIGCSQQGIVLYQQACRAANDRLLPPSYKDPAYPGVRYSDIELQWFSTLDTAAVFPNLSDVTSLAAEAVGQPRYFWINAKYLKPIWHKSKYFLPTDLLQPPNQPFTRVQYFDCWSNLFLCSRRRQGIIAPLSTIVTRALGA